MVELELDLIIVERGFEEELDLKIVEIHLDEVIRSVIRGVKVVA